MLDWDYKRASWNKLKEEARHIDWSFLHTLPVEDVAFLFIDTVLATAMRHIPTRTISEHKTTHPWLDDACRQAVMNKNATDLASPEFVQRCQTMTETLGTARSSKQWWKLNRILLNSAPARTSIPSLKDGCSWIHDPTSKGELFAKRFSSKFVLPPEQVPPVESTVDVPSPMAHFIQVKPQASQQQSNKDALFERLKAISQESDKLRNENVVRHQAAEERFGEFQRDVDAKMTMIGDTLAGLQDGIKQSNAAMDARLNRQEASMVNMASKLDQMFTAMQNEWAAKANAAQPSAPRSKRQVAYVFLKIVNALCW